MKRSPNAAAESPHADAELVIVYCKMFLKAKFHANGTFDRIAARLVGGGHTQPDSSYGDTFAPATDATTKLTATFAFFAYAAKIGKADRVHTWSFDINGAFLHCKLDSKIPVFARLPPNIGPLSNQLVRVLGGLYGLKQVNRTFYLDLVATMTTLGFVQSDADECLFIRSKPGHPHHTVVYFHVDDGHALSLSEATNQFLIDGLTARYGELKLDKEGASHAGWCIERTPTGVTIHQAGYIASLAEKYSDLISAARGPKPNVPHNSHLFEPATDATPVPQPQYQELIGCLMHAKQTRHDCCLASCPTLHPRTPSPSKPTSTTRSTSSDTSSPPLALGLASTSRLLPNTAPASSPTSTPPSPRTPTHAAMAATSLQSAPPLAQSSRAATLSPIPPALVPTSN